MSDNNIIVVPDVGSDDEVTVIEIFVKAGSDITKDMPLVTLESDKASMDIPADVDGTIDSLLVKVGDKVKEGTPLLSLKTAESKVKTPANETKAPEVTKDVANQEIHPVAPTKLTSAAEKKIIELRVPDLGGASEVDVIDVAIKAGDEVKIDDALMTLEGDKATMDIPATQAGIIQSVSLKVGDKCSEGSVIALLETTLKKESPKAAEDKVTPSKPVKVPVSVAAETSSNEKSQEGKQSNPPMAVYASPSIRRIAREFGVDLSKLSGSGRKGRILKEDVQAFVKEQLAKPQTGFGIPNQPEIDFSKFGEVEKVALNKIKRLTAENMVRSWLTVPHVTQFDEADITELEAFRQSKKGDSEKAGYKLTILAFITKAIAKCLEAFPEFNSSLSHDASSLIYKKYVNIGIAVDTPNGLVVPVIKGVDALSVSEIAIEMGRLSQLARDKKLTPREMTGGSFTISSLGGIGGNAFTPIVNAPEVAILGLSKAKMSPVYQGGAFVPRLMLPLSLSYDHRVIDGAEAARFTRHLSNLLSDIRNLLI